MVSVTKRISQISQPRGGYINPKEFTVVERNDGLKLGEDNIHASLIGLAVDYLTRYSNGTEAEEAFKISLRGAEIIGLRTKAEELVRNVKGLDDVSIISACKLSAFDVCYRAGPMSYKPFEEVNPDKETIENIRIMVKRGLSFIEEYGPIVKDGFSFNGGYTDTVTVGDGDFLSQDTLWDFKVSKSKPKKEHTLQLMMYYLMGMRSIHPEFKNVRYLGIFNPRLNTVYKLEIGKVNKDVISEIEKDVICY